LRNKPYRIENNKEIGERDWEKINFYHHQKWKNTYKRKQMHVPIIWCFALKNKLGARSSGKN
jgi:hypothetical protein